MIYTFIEFFVEHIQYGWMDGLWNVLSKTSMHKQCIYIRTYMYKPPYIHTFISAYIFIGQNIANIAINTHDMRPF